jgi:transketolase
MRNTFVSELIEQAKKDSRIWLITADMGYSVLEPFRDMFPERFINCGIAEQNAIGIAAGLALKGKLPYVYSIASFITSRPYEQIKIDAAYMNTNIRIMGMGGGYYYGAAGATHHAIEDIALMRALPNMSVCAPSTLNESKELLKYSFKHNGPIYIRLDKSPNFEIFTEVEFGKLSAVFAGKRGDFAIIFCGNMLENALKIAEEYKAAGKNPLLFSAHTLKPFDANKILELINENIPIITMEEHNAIGGLASAVSDIIARGGKGVKFLPLAIEDKFSHYIGGREFIKSKIGLCGYKNKIDELMGYE